MVLELFRWVLTTALFNMAMLYAAYIAMRPAAPFHGAVAGGKETLKLWMVLAVICAFCDTFGYAVLSWIPLFYEFRCVAVWSLILMEPKSWALCYDAVLSTGAVWLLRRGHDLKTTLPVRRFVHACMTASGSMFLLTVEAAVSCGTVPSDLQAVEHLIDWTEKLSRSTTAVAPTPNQSCDDVTGKSITVGDHPDRVVTVAA